MIRQGLIPTLLGTAVTGVGLVAVQGTRTKDIAPMIAAGVVGFGLAHIVLGSIDLIQGRQI
ncbi:hypothetical protein [Tissierella sp. P1]|uniref:hypothetical protein n=1 Tax=unclassified Tissierella TaxID=2638726 RepID=UPI0019135AA5|nr:hypothetical protein [Tissierella sp. P1]